MSWFNPAKELSDKTREALKIMAESGSSEAAGVADILNTIAENGGEQTSDEYLIACAEEVKDAVQAFINAMKN